MIGFYNYTVFLTYLSLASASTGIIISLTGAGHPFVGTFFLLFCGLCDAFDGRIARTKKDRTETECKYGIQIDSLSDIVAFGILPVCIGAALVFRSDVFTFDIKGWALPFSIMCFAVMALYVLAAMIRLAFFNVSEEERQKTEGGCRKYYLGLPVTLGSLMLPPVLILQYILEQIFTVDLTYIYFVAMLAIAVAFVSRFHLPKPGMRGVLIMSAFGFVETVLLAIALLVF